MLLRLSKEPLVFWLVAVNDSRFGTATLRQCESI